MRRRPGVSMPLTSRSGSFVSARGRNATNGYNAKSAADKGPARKSPRIALVNIAISSTTALRPLAMICGSRSSGFLEEYLLEQRVGRRRKIIIDFQDQPAHQRACLCVAGEEPRTGRGKASSRYSTIAFDSYNTKSPSTNTGT
jgi:hypothetical protein